jgi:branched-chain amino acid transport system substrate-binding protein
MMIQESFRLWAKQVNQRGGILGRKVKMVLYDDKSQPRLVKHYYQKLIEEDNVDLIFSPHSTP